MALVVVAIINGGFALACIGLTAFINMRLNAHQERDDAHHAEIHQRVSKLESGEG